MNTVKMMRGKLTADIADKPECIRQAQSEGWSVVAEEKSAENTVDSGETEKKPAENTKKK